MKIIDVENWDRKRTYNFFKEFSNSTYSCNATMDVTKLVNFSKANSSSFFINMLYVVVNGLNSIEEMRMRLADGKPVIYDDISPAYTVMIQNGNFENVRHDNYKDYKSFYDVAEKSIDIAKNQNEIEDVKYNPENCWSEYYITCLPWINFSQFTHPIPDDIQSQCIPRIGWGKYEKNDDKYELTLSITVSHIFVDGYPLSNAFINIQNLLNDVENLLK